MLTRKNFPVVYRLFALALLAGCTSQPTPMNAVAAVTIHDFKFQPTDITVQVGTTVTWTNMDSASHTVTASDGSFASDPLSSQKTFSQRFGQAGTFAYHCNIHPEMTATIHVIAP